MSLIKKVSLYGMVLAVSFALSAWGACPSADLTGDCVVDLADLAAFGLQWLETPGTSANLDGNPGVTLSDFAVLSAQWQTRGRTATLVINEFMADNNNFYFDNAGNDDDWIEIYNYGDQPVDIGGMFITDQLDSLTPYRIPEGYPEQTTIPAGGHLILWADDELAQGPLHVKFKLAAGGGEDIVLFDSSRRLIDSILDFGPQAENNSYGRFPDAGTEWVTFVHDTAMPPTPGKTNGGRLPEDEILFTEIMYHPYNAAHPLAEDILEEYIEIYNRGFSAVALDGWRLTDGVDFTFPPVAIGPGEYLVVAADTAAFAAKYPSVKNVVGGWIGRLSNSAEVLELTTADGKVIDRIRYADQGDWARRILGPLDNNHRGWLWADDHDGQGKSLELISMAMPNEYGHNWSASLVTQGTPGAVNSVDIGARSGGVAPLIVEAEHAPIIPRSTDAVTVTARVLDEQIAGVTVSLYFRIDGQPAFDTVAMLDNGLDADAGDRVFSARIPANADGTVVEFYVGAVDADGNARTRPGPCDVNGTPSQVANMLYQVDDSFDPKAAWQPQDQPVYRIIMTEVQRAELDRIGSTGGDANSDAQMNGTFISADGVDIKVRYNVGVRNRGHGTRTSRPNNYHVSFPTDRPWKDVVGINLNTQYTWLQLAGSAIFQRSGLATGDAKAVQVRVNGRNLANSGSPQYGSYAHIEAINSEYTDHQFPDNSAGNVYKCMRVTAEADLRYLGEDPAAYRSNYFKETNESYDDWTDLIELTRVLSNTPEDQYIQEVERVVNVDWWLRFLALNVLLDNSETTLANGNGDDYFLYRGDTDRRFVLIQHDLDSIFGQGQSIGSATADIFPFLSGAGGENAVAALVRLVGHPQYAPRYYGHLKDLIENNLSAGQLSPFLDNLLGGYVPAQTLANMKSWQAQRNAYVLSLIPSDLTIETGLSKVGNYYQSADEQVALGGVSDAVRTRSVTVNGLPAEWSALNARWSIGSGSAGSNEEMIVPRGSAWRYLDDGSNQTNLWIATDYNDSGWHGPQATRLGYGDDGETLPKVGYIDTDPVASGTQKNITTYFRHTFTVADPSKYSQLRIGLLRDDGAAVYLNGKPEPLITSNLSTTPLTYTTRADGNIDAADEQVFFNYTVDAGNLKAGVNVLAVEVHQSSSSSSDVGFNFELAGIIDNPSAVTGVPINPGITRITVQAFDGPDGTGKEIDRDVIDIWQNNSVPVNLSGTLTQNTTLDAASGPYTVTGDLIVPSGVTLTINAGTTVLFNSSTGITVNGRVVAEGTEFNHIRLAPNPQTSATRWDGLAFRNTLTDNRLVYVDMDHGDGQGDSIIVNTARIFMNYLTFTSTNNTTAIMELTHPSAVIRNCVFPSISATEPLHGSGLSGSEYLIFDGCTFGTTTGYNDLLDFTGGKRPGPIIQMYNNYFAGGGDDALDFDDTDGHIEGNVFLSFANGYDGNVDNTTSNAVATDFGSDVVIARNVFIGGDHHVLLKNDVSITAQNNTFIGATMASINFGEPGRGVGPGDGAYLENSIFWNNARVFFNIFDNPAFPGYGPDPMPTIFNTIVPSQWHSLGTGNIDTDPLFVNPAGRDFSLQPGSPAIGAGTNGLDMGYLVPGGASISGAPAPVSDSTEATLHVGGPGIVSYKYRLVDDGVPGAWSAEIALPIDGAGFPVDPDSILGVLSLTGLVHGHSYRVDVLGKNSAGLWQGQTVGTNTGFAVPGNPEGNSSKTWLVNIPGAPEPTLPPDPAMGAGSLDDIPVSLVDTYINGPNLPAPPDNTPTPVGGILSGDTTWEPQSGPYQVTSTLTVPAGITLTIQAGTTVYFDGGTQLTVNGKIRAEGQPYNLIRFTRTPTGTGVWNGIQLSNTVQDNLLSHAVVEYAETSNGAIGLTNSAAVLEHLTWSGSRRRLIRTNNASVIIRNCVFPDRFGPTEFPGTSDDNVVEAINATGILAGGQYIIENNIFGTNKGHNDIVDFSGPGLPGPILQVLNNTFMGGGDECLDLGGDSWIEGNRFMHVHKDVYNTGSGDSNAISTGDDDFDAVMMIVRNVFFDIDHVIDLKTGTYMYFEHNTVVGIKDDEGSNLYSAFKFLIPGRDPEGKGAYLDSNIFYDIPKRIFENVDQSFSGDPSFVTQLEMHNCLIPAGRIGDTVGNRPGTIMDLGTGNFAADPLFVDPSGDFRLRVTSPAAGAAPGGIDLGAIVPSGAAVTGEPAPTTWRNQANLTVAGPGIVAYKYRLNGDSWSPETPVSSPITLSGLSNGQTYAVEVLGKNRAGLWQSDSEPTRAKSWTVDTGYSRLVINEILADNTATLNLRGTFPDLVELYYDGPTELPLDGMSITDDLFNPTAFVFPVGTIIQPGQYLVLYADVSVQPGEIHLGFALENRGEGLYLFDQNGQRIDAVEFGQQVADLSVGRDSAGQWRLTEPSFGGANIVHPLGDRRALYINEWLANGQVSFVEDFVEFFNPSELPVDLGGLYITDNPVSQPEKYVVGPLSFAPAKGFVVFDADGQNLPGHFPFRLSSDQGLIALLESDTAEIDWVVYGPQTTDVSQGRSPDGDARYDFFEIPTPGVANPKSATRVISTATVIPENAAKKVLVPTAAVDAAWKGGSAFDDSAWNSGVLVAGKAGGVGYENNPGDATNYVDLITYDIKSVRTGTCYIRVPFTLTAEQVASISSLNLRIRFDDAFIAYINGVTAAQTANVPASPAWNSYASSAGPGDSTARQLADYPMTNASVLSALKVGQNILAVHGMDATSSSDMILSFILDMTTEVVSGGDDLTNQKALMKGLRVTELMYNPVGGTDLEFIELQNIGLENCDITGVRLDDGISFTFPDKVLAPGEYVVVVNNAAAFAAQYGSGIPVAGEFTGNLSNGGESVVVRLPVPLQAALLRIEYSDAWYPSTDGAGYALVIRNVTADRALWSQAAGWSAGANVNGSPGTAD